MGSFVPICTISFRGVSLFSSIANINNLIDDFTLCYDPTLHYITFGKVTTPVSLKIVPNFIEQQKIPLFHTFFHFFRKMQYLPPFCCLILLTLCIVIGRNNLDCQKQFNFNIIFVIWKNSFFCEKREFFNFFYKCSSMLYEVYSEFDHITFIK